jgi:mannitol/fructose-specific phosphotransferase system IIA component (Ntr-type)
VRNVVSWTPAGLKFFKSNTACLNVDYYVILALGSMTSLAQFTEPGLLVPRLTGDHRESVITELCRRLEKSGRIDSIETFSRAVMEHEELAAAVFDGVAFPLAHKGAFKELSFAMGLAPQPIHWGAPHAPLVHTVVLFAVPVPEEKQYLSLVLAFSNLLKDGKTLVALRACARPEEMLEILGRIRF